MSNPRVWFKYKGNETYQMRDDVIFINHCNFTKYKTEITETINLFNKFIDYPEMWDLRDAEDRINEGQQLFLLRDERGPIGHLWMDKNYLYNVYMCEGRKYLRKKRDRFLSVKFVRHCFNFSDYDVYYAQIDDWNNKSIQLAIRFGAEIVDEPTYIKTKKY